MRVESQIAARDQHVADIHAHADGAELKTGGQFGGQIFQAVNGEVGLAVQQRVLDFLGEQTLGQIRAGQRGGLQLVAGGLDDLEFKQLARKRGAKLGQNHVGLGESERAAARGDADGGG